MTARSRRRAAAVAPSLSFIASGEGTGATVTIPGTPTADDICVIWSWFRNTLSSGGLASGFTNGVNQDASGTSEGGGRIQIKKLTGSETTVTIEAGTNATSWLCATFRPSSPVAGFVVNDTATEATNNDPAAQTVSVAGIPGPTLALAHARQGTINLGTMTTITNSGFTSHVAGYKIDNPGGSPADITVDTTDGGSQNLLQSLYLTFT